MIDTWGDVAIIGCMAAVGVLFMGLRFAGFLKRNEQRARTAIEKKDAQ